MIISNNTSPKSEVVTHVDGDYLPARFEDIQSGDTIRIRHDGIVQTTTDPLTVRGTVESDAHKQFHINTADQRMVKYNLSHNHSAIILRLIPVLPKVAGSLILINRASKHANAIPGGTLAQLFVGKFGHPLWHYFDQFGIQHEIHPENILKWRPAFITTTNPNAKDS